LIFVRVVTGVEDAQAAAFCNALRNSPGQRGIGDRTGELCENPAFRVRT